MPSPRKTCLLVLFTLGVLLTPVGTAHASRPSVPTPAPAASKCFGPDFICDAGTLVTSGLADEVVEAAIETTVNGGVAAVGEGLFGSIAREFGEAGVSFLGSLAEAFVESSTLDLSNAGIDPIMAIATPLAMLAAVILVIIAAARAAVTGQGSVIANALIGVGKTILVTALIVTVVQTALYASDEITEWIIDATLGGNDQLEERLGALITVSAIGSSAALILIFGLIAVIISLVLWVELLFRNVAIVVLVAMSPIAAAGTVLDGTNEWWVKARTALIQLILLKPIIALCFAIGFSTFGAASDLVGVIAGFVTLGLAAVAWPLLARFMTFTQSGHGHAAVAGLLGATAGALAGRRVGAPTSGPGASSGSGYTLALEQQNDSSIIKAGRGAGGTSKLSVVGSGALAAAGAVTTAGTALLGHAERQMTSASADSGLGHVTYPRGMRGHTPGRFASAGRSAPTHRRAGVADHSASTEAPLPARQEQQPEKREGQ